MTQSFPDSTMKKTLKTLKDVMNLSKSFLALGLVVGMTFGAKGQINEDVSTEEIAGEVDTIQISYPYTVAVIDERDHVPYSIIVEDPKVIEARLKSIEKTMPMVYNESVEYWLNFFTQRRPNFTKNMMENVQVYFPVFERILKANGMPEELKYLAILESGLNPKAVSRSKAVGLWQFMSFTGKEYGLTINQNIDERMHVEKSTEAACRYLKYLNRMFDDWDLALASYNTGQGRISRTMKKTGLTNYWDLHPYIHRDTRAYVPQFIALAYLMNFGKEHGIKPDVINRRPDLDNIYIDGNVDLDMLAQLIQVDVSEIQKFNPHIKATVLPESLYGYEIALPVVKANYFNTNRVAFIDSMNKKYRTTNVVVPENPTLLASNVEANEDGEIVIGNKPTKPAVEYVEVTKKVKKIHKVKRGEILNRIAAKYHVTPTEIRKWNNKSSSKVLVGEKLAIYVEQTSKVKSNSLAAKSSSESVKQPIYHTVRRGDTLWNISQKYEGVSVNDIKKWNNIKGNQVMVGQKIKIQS